MINMSCGHTRYLGQVADTLARYQDAANAGALKQPANTTKYKSVSVPKGSIQKHSITIDFLKTWLLAKNYYQIKIKMRANVYDLEWICQVRR